MRFALPATKNDYVIIAGYYYSANSGYAVGKHWYKAPIIQIPEAIRYTHFVPSATNVLPAPLCGSKVKSFEKFLYHAYYPTVCKKCRAIATDNQTINQINGYTWHPDTRFIGTVNDIDNLEQWRIECETWLKRMGDLR